MNEASKRCKKNKYNFHWRWLRTTALQHKEKKYVHLGLEEWNSVTRRFQKFRFVIDSRVSTVLITTDEDAWNQPSFLWLLLAPMGGSQLQFSTHGALIRITSTSPCRNHDYHAEMRFGISDSHFAPVADIQDGCSGVTCDANSERSGKKENMRN